MNDYLSYNALELASIVVAMTMSRFKVVPLFLCCYVIIMTIVFCNSNAHIEHIDKVYNDYIEYNKALVIVYIFESLMMFALSLVLIFYKNKLSLLVRVMILIQASLSAFVAFSVGAITEYDIDLWWIFDVHYSLQSIFSVIFSLIAWMCVYYSRASYENLR